MAQRLSEQVVEWLTVGGDSFTPHFKSNDTKTSVPLVVNKPGTATTFPTTGGTAIGIYNNQGQIWTLRDAASTAKALMSGQLIISSSDSGAGGISALELWRGTNASWQIANDGGVFYFRNNYGKTSTSSSSETKQTTYTYDNVSFRYGALAEQYVRIHSTKDSNYEHTTTGAALIVDGGATFKKKVYIDDDTDSNYVSGADGALVVNGGASIGQKLYVGSTQASTSSTTGALVVNGGVGIAGDTNIATNKYLKVGQYITIGGNGDPADRSILSSTTLYVGSSGNASLVFKTNNTARARFNASGHFIPETNATYDIGSTTNRWKDFYLTGVIRVGAASTTYNTAAGDTVYIDNNEIIVNTGSTSSSGYYIFGKGSSYGRWYVGTFGTAGTYTPAEGETPASSTNGTQGEAILIVGNATAVTPSSATSLGANNARGRVRLYGTGTTYTDLLPNPNGSRTVYLPYYAGTMYLVHGGSATAVIGGTRNPVYVAANGRVTAGAITFDSLTKNRLMWTTDTDKPYAGYHYASSTKVAINSTTEPTTNFMVSGTSIFTGAVYVGAKRAYNDTNAGWYIGADGTMHGYHATRNSGLIRLHNEGNFQGRIERKVANGNGWAYSPFEIVDNANHVFTQIGVYGTANTLSYVFIGADQGYNGNNFKVYPTGLISSTANSNTVTIGSQNANWCHIYNSADIPFIFNKTVATTSGDLGTSTYKWTKGYFKGDIIMQGTSTSANNRIYFYYGDGNQEGFVGHSIDGTHFGLYSARLTKYIVDVQRSNNRIYFADSYNGTATALAYSQSALAASAITYLTCWNGYELRAITKAEMATAVDGSHKWVRLAGDTMTGNLTISKSGEPGFLLQRTDYSPNHSAYMYVQAMGANKPSSLMFYVANAAGTRSSTFALDGEYGIILINKNYSGTLPSSGGRTGRLYFKTI